MEICCKFPDFLGKFPDFQRSLSNSLTFPGFPGQRQPCHLCKKIVDHRSEVDLEYISISETKLDASFPNSQFKIEGYHFPPFRRDRNSYGGGLMVFIKNDIIATRATEYEPMETECICTKITISKKLWLIFSIYRPPKSNLENFIQVLHQATDRAISKYNNIVIMGDLNVNTLDHSLNLDKLNELCDTLGLYNLIKVSTCEMKGSSTCIDLILTNCRRQIKAVTSCSTHKIDQQETDG